MFIEKEYFRQYQEFARQTEEVDNIALLNPFNLQPSWYIDTCELQIAENLEYLGTFLGSSAHISKRITSCRRAFYSLQGAGICKNGLEVNTAVYVFKATCSGILKYASDSVYLSQKQRSDLKIQGNLLKCLVGLGPRYRTTPLLNAVYMSKVSSIIDMGNISLLNQIMRISSAARTLCYKMTLLVQKSLLIG